METMYWRGTRSSRDIGDMEERGRTDNKSREIPGKKLENQFIHQRTRNKQKQRLDHVGCPFKYLTSLILTTKFEKKVRLQNNI